MRMIGPAELARSLARALLAALVFAPLAFAQSADPFEKALERYNETIKRLPLHFHTDGREKLARTRKPEALAILAKDYADTKDPGRFPEYTRYMLATLFGRNFDRAEFVDALKALRTANRKPGDTWLWVQALKIQADRGDAAEVLAIATGEKNTLLRAAAIAGLGATRNPDLKAFIVPNCAAFPKKDAERMAILGAMSGALFANKGRVNDELYRAALTAYIGLLADEIGLSHTAKVQVARHLQVILKSNQLYVNPEAWLELLARGEVKRGTTSPSSAAPRFFGIETDGERLCYVVDMSDSMCKKIEPAAKPSGPLSGPKEKKKKGAILDESDIPWHRIDTRWDLARENLRVSLSRLTPDKQFCIVWFGSQAGTLESCPGMIKATRANIDKVMDELDAIVPGPSDSRTALDGKLKGETNMHSGLKLAFALTKSGFAQTEAYVDGAALTEGCDTILMLSDGTPSVDDFTVNDKDYGEGEVVVDQEYKVKAERAPNLNYPGPFIFSGDPNCPWIVDDVRRMNAFRRIRIHCVGLGEANMTLLKELATIGQGQSFAVGHKRDDPPPPGK
ncbi:MAG: hypothetical protein FJ298_00110 [Planctomycetes bacterium]|nr:hypothetical protein [Planctomycetota bacterium]